MVFGVDVCGEEDYYVYKWYRVVQSGESVGARPAGEPLIFFKKSKPLGPFTIRLCSLANTTTPSTTRVAWRSR